MKNQDHAKFGKVLFGVESVKGKMAETANARHAHFKNGTNLKEHFVVPALLCGMGTGKSTMLESHLNVLRERCSDPDLIKLLNNHPLVLNVTYNSSMTFTLEESTEPIGMCLARRMISSYFGIPWDYASTLKLGDKHGVVTRTLNLLVAHHKQQHELDDFAHIAVILNVDEVNTIAQTLQYQEKGNDKSVELVGEVLKIVRDLSMDGVANRSPVIPLVAGTAQQLVVDAAKGSGVRSLVHNLPVLSNTDIHKALRLCKVDEQYFNNPDFIRLLDDTGGVPRLIRFVLEALTVQYDASRIPIARASAELYIQAKMLSIPLHTVHVLLADVLMGQSVSINSPLSHDPVITYDGLQRQGSVWMNAVEGNASAYRVIVPMMALKSICLQHSLRDVGVGRVSHMLNLLERTDWDHFEELVAHYHSFIGRTLARNRSSVSLGEIYKGVAMHPDVAAIELLLNAGKDYETLSRRSGKNEHRFPLTESNRNSKEAVRVTSQLLNGKVVVNNRGTAVDVMQVDPLTAGGILVRAICVKHTEGVTKLKAKEVGEDSVKAVEAVMNCEQLVAVSETKKPNCVVIHISNRHVDKNVDLTPLNAIVVARHNLEAFFGPVLSRGMMSRTHLRRSVNQMPGQKGFCTLRHLHLQSNSLPRTVVHRLVLVTRLLCKCK